MTKSMTGFCKVEVQHKGKSCSVEMRSVNHRYLESRISLPKAFAHLEESLKQELKKRLSRGKVDVNLSLDNEGQVEEQLQINTEVLSQLNSTVKGLEEGLGKPIQIALTDLLQIKGLMNYVLQADEDYDYAGLFGLAIDQGAKALCQMREKEGALMKLDVLSHIEVLKEQINQVQLWVPEVQKNAKAKLTQGLLKLGLELDPEDPRVMQEIGFQMDRVDVTEEVERFQIHIIHLSGLLDAATPVGRKIDFLMQELNREANTLCSKAAHPKITEIGVTLKSELEKIREQIQNIE